MKFPCQLTMPPLQKSRKKIRCRFHHIREGNKKAAEAWEEIRKELLHGAVVSIPIPSNAICVICHKEAATVLCKQCGSHGYFCEACAVNLHSSINLLHAPVIQKVHL